MQYTGRQIVNSNIITDYDSSSIQQQGVDVRVIDIREVYGTGFIPKEGKTRKNSTQVIPTENFYDSGSERTGWILQPGYYEVTFQEGCKIPANVVLHFDPRSSLVRCGGRVFSGQFDGGFETEHMGCFMVISKNIRIEKLARIAQVRVEETYPVDEKDLYNGQWQNDKQRLENIK